MHRLSLFINLTLLLHWNTAQIVYFLWKSCFSGQLGESYFYFQKLKCSFQFLKRLLCYKICVILCYITLKISRKISKQPSPLYRFSQCNCQLSAIVGIKYPIWPVEINLKWPLSNHRKENHNSGDWNWGCGWGFCVD